MSCERQQASFSRNARKENDRGKGALLYTSIVTVWIYRRDQAEHVHPPLLYPKESWPWIKSLIYDRYTCISIPQRADYRPGRNGREVGRCFFVESVPTIPLEGNILVILPPPPPPPHPLRVQPPRIGSASADSSFAVFFALLPRGWCFRGSATDKIFRVEAGYSRAVFPDVRVFLPRISLERNWGGRGNPFRAWKFSKREREFSFRLLRTSLNAL